METISNVSVILACDGMKLMLCAILMGIQYILSSTYSYL